MNLETAPPIQPIPVLTDCRLPGQPAVRVTLLRGVPAEQLERVEQSWTPARDQLAADMLRAELHLENRHWRWTRKEGSTRAGEHLLLAIEAEGEVQGLLALKTRLRRSILNPGQWVLYVDYIETAPWNLNIVNVQTPRFAGVGTLLIGEAIRTSMGRTCGGRIGLHALPQAERFYADRCRMTRIGPDPLYGDLIYFEYADGVVAGWLSDQGLSA